MRNKTSFFIKIRYACCISIVIWVIWKRSRWRERNGRFYKAYTSKRTHTAAWE